MQSCNTELPATKTIPTPFHAAKDLHAFNLQSLTSSVVCADYLAGRTIGYTLKTSCHREERKEKRKTELAENNKHQENGAETPI